MPTILEYLRGGVGLCGSTAHAPDLLLCTLCLGSLCSQHSSLYTTVAQWISVALAENKQYIFMHSLKIYSDIE